MKFQEFAAGTEISGEEVYNDYVEKNSGDFYGAGILKFVQNWANHMENEVEKNNGILTKDIMSKSGTVADTDGIAGFMYGLAVQMLTQVWIYGKQLQLIHNGVYDFTANDDVSVVNPAIMNISIPDDDTSNGSELPEIQE